MANKVGSVFAVCKFCGSLFEVESGKDIPDCCGRESCKKSANNSRVVSMPIYGANASIVTYSGGQDLGGSEEPQNDKNMVKLAKNVDTRKKDNDNAKKIEKDIKKRFGIKTKKTGKKADGGSIGTSKRFVFRRGHFNHYRQRGSHCGKL